MVTLPVITASKTATLTELAQAMTENKVPCIVILEDSSHGQAFATPSRSAKTRPPYPLGLVTDQQLIRLQSQPMTPEQPLAQSLLTGGPFCVFNDQTAFWPTYQTMAQQQWQYCMVVDQHGALLGLISQTSVLKQALDLMLKPNTINDLQQQLLHERHAHQVTRRLLATVQSDLKELSEEQLLQQAKLKKDLLKRKRVEAALRQTLETLKKTQAQIIQDERMAGLGQLIAGIAHEINNPINFIHANLIPAKQYAEQLLELVHFYEQKLNQRNLASLLETEILESEIRQIDPDFISEDFPKLLDSMEKGTNRIQTIVESLRNFSRLDEAELKPVDIHEGLENTLMIVQRHLKGPSNQAMIQVIRQYSQLPKVECFASQLNQVFLHLISNAIDSLHERSRLASKEEDPPRPILKICTRIINADRVAIDIIDNGLGISDTCQARMFDPFYTTKPVGQGSGLGLSISHQTIVQQHRGRLRVTSMPNEGATFTIELPQRHSKRDNMPAIAAE